MKKLLLYSAIYTASIALLALVIYIISPSKQGSVKGNITKEPNGTCTTLQLANKDVPVPQDWAEYKFNDGAFSIKVPPTVELRRDSDKYTQIIANSGMPTLIDKHTAVFQQKGLSFQQEEAKGKYARIILKFYTEAPNSFPKKHESIDDILTKQDVDEIINGELAGVPIKPNVYDIKYSSETINGNHCFIIRYIRTGINGAPPVKSKICIFFNDKYFVKLIYSYRMVHSEIWANDFDKSLQTFRWLK